MPRQYCAVALGELLMPVYLYHYAVELGIGQSAVTLQGWESNCSTGHISQTYRYNDLWAQDQ